MAKRKAISTKDRFEVFKRDKFTCQYCGRKAPDVILHIDHINPVSKGGKNKIQNYITSCVDCNLGKGARLLSDQTAIEKFQKQAEEIQERRNQLEMMMQWHSELENIEEETLRRISGYWAEQSNQQYVLNENGLKDLRLLLKKFSVPEILTAIKTAAEAYFEIKDGEYTRESINRGWNKVGGICNITRRKTEDPEISDLYYIRGILRNRLVNKYYDNNMAIALLRKARNAKASIVSLKDFVSNVNNWSEFNNGIEEFLGENK